MLVPAQSARPADTGVGCDCSCHCGSLVHAMHKLELPLYMGVQQRCAAQPCCSCICTYLQVVEVLNDAAEGLLEVHVLGLIEGPTIAGGRVQLVHLNTAHHQTP